MEEAEHRSVRVACERDWLPESVPHLPVLYARWGLPLHADVPELSAFSSFAEHGPAGIAWTSSAEADFLLLPFDYRHSRNPGPARETAIRLATRARDEGKRLLAFYWSDDSRPLELPSCIAFRTSLDRGSAYWVNEFCAPGWLSDPLASSCARNVELRPKRLRPSVGFCGFTLHHPAGRTLLGATLDVIRQTRARFELRRGRAPIPLRLRQLALRELRQDSRIDTDFIERDQFFGGAFDRDGTLRPDARERVRSDYFQNIFNTDYTLCVRGAGNFSHRYFDTLACGRIPLLIDTGGGIPYDFHIDWTESGPVVPMNRLLDLPDIILDFHERLTDIEFVTLQRKNRRRFEQFLSPEGFFASFPLHFTPGAWRQAVAWPTAGATS